MTERSDPMDANSLCIGCVRWNKDCPLDPTCAVRDCVEFMPKDTWNTYLRDTKENKPCEPG